MLNQLSGVECPNITFVDEDFPVVLKKGSGMNLWDTDGNRYLDFTACFGVAALGHRPKIALDAMRKQAAKLIHGMGDVHPTESKIKFLKLLSSLLPYARSNTILSSSGSEAVETALKTAVLATGREQFVSYEGGYHGLLTGPLRLNGRPLFVRGFENWLGAHVNVLPFPKAEAALARLEEVLCSRKIAAVVLEPVQGRGGNRVFPKEYVVEAQGLAKKYGSLMIFDEIFTGFGRTAKMFGFEHFGVVPDIICLGKAMGGGMPLSACAGDVLEVWGKSTGEARHTSTFLGHPLSCAVGFATVKEIRKQLPLFVSNLDSIEAELTEFAQRCEISGLAEKHPFEITGKGFMRGIRFLKEQPGFVFELTKKLLKNGFIVLPCGENGEVLSLTPPLIATSNDYQKILSTIELILMSNKMI